MPNTRKWVLEPFRQTHPLVDALLEWRKDERIATTYGYRWLDEHVGPDGRLRGGWTACDGAAGRMTAQNGLHNLPGSAAARRSCAEPGHVFVRADLGQIEPRVLAVVSGDRAFAEATRADDLYAPVAAKLGVERPVAKVAVLAAMYGQRSGAAGEALKDLERAYPVAMGLLDERVRRRGGAREPLRTFGGRRHPHRSTLAAGPGGADAGPGAARGRFARNAIIQGSAAELFKAWAATVRPRRAPLGAQIVLCLHDELLRARAGGARRGGGAAASTARWTTAARRWAGTDGAVRRRHLRHPALVRRQGLSRGAGVAGRPLVAPCRLPACRNLHPRTGSVPVRRRRSGIGRDSCGGWGQAWSSSVTSLRNASNSAPISSAEGQSERPRWRAGWAADGPRGRCRTAARARCTTAVTSSDPSTSRRSRRG